LEDDNSYEVEMAAPSLNKDDFKIELNNDVLTISSEKQTENETKEGQRYTRKEFSYQSFSRSFTLPDSVDNDKIKAKYENGVLRVIIPKREDAKPRPVKQIAIE